MLYSDCKAWMAVPRIGIRRLRSEGNCADTAQAHKRVETCGFARRPLNLIPAPRAD